jgi:serine/threonine protein kinase
MRWRLRAKPADYTETLARLAEVMNMQTAKPTTPRELSRQHIKIISNLGKGQFGTVDKGIIDERVGSVPGYLCAIKQLLTTDPSGITSLMEESAIMAQLDSDFCVRLIGVVTVGAPVMMVLEYCEHGALNSYLKKTAGTNEEDFRLQIAGDCCEGLEYLAGRGFIHRDVAARNVLVSSELRGKISDFGMSREADESDYYHSSGGVVPVRWCAPEVLCERKYSSKSDVWAFGVLLFEIWSDGATPYAGWTNKKVLMEVELGTRLSKPSDCSDSVYRAMLKCWDTDPHKREDFSTLKSFFRGEACSTGSRSLRDGGCMLGNVAEVVLMPLERPIAEQASAVAPRSVSEYTNQYEYYNPPYDNHLPASLEGTVALSEMHQVLPEVPPRRHSTCLTKANDYKLSVPEHARHGDEEKVSASTTNISPGSHLSASGESKPSPPPWLDVGGENAQGSVAHQRKPQSKPTPAPAKTTLGSVSPPSTYGSGLADNPFYAANINASASQVYALASSTSKLELINQLSHTDAPWMPTTIEADPLQETSLHVPNLGNIANETVEA